MNILLINHYAGSLQHGMEYRPFYMGREWTRMGHRVSIAAASCSHMRSTPAAAQGTVSEEVIHGLRYLWFKTPQYSGNGARRALNMFTFVGQLLRHADLLSGTCHGGAVIASSTYPLDIFPAAAIARAAGARLAFEVHDLWPLSPMELGGMSPFHPFIMIMQAAENFAYRHAHRVISMLPNAAPHMRKHGLRADRFVHIPNGFDPAEWQADTDDLPSEHREILTELKRNKKFIVLYAGAHGIANALDSLVGSAALLRDTSATILLVGQGPEKPALQDLASRLGLSNVLFLPPVKKKSMPALLSQADALIIALRRTSLFRFGISPNKLIDYMMAGKPVIQAIEAGNDMVAESGCGISVRPEDPRAIADAVGWLMRLSPAERLAIGERGRQYVTARHDYGVLASDFIKALQSA